MSSSLKLYYASGDAYSNIRENLGTLCLSTLTVGFSLAIVALFAIVFYNLNEMVTRWGDRTHIVAYVQEGTSSVRTKALGKEIRAVKGVKSAQFISSAKAFELLKKDFKNQGSILEGVDPDILPASFEIKLGSEYMDPGKIKLAVTKIRRLPGIGEVQYGEEWIEKLSSFLGFIEFAATVMCIFLAAAALFVISNTVRLAVYARKEELEIMKLVGASNTFIKVPYIIEGLVVGLIGGFVATAMLLAGQYIFMLKVPTYFSFVVESPLGIVPLILILVTASCVLGVLASMVSLGKFLKA